MGGALTDRLGRRRMLIFGLLASSFSTLLMGFIESLQAFYVLALLSGVFTDVAGPAHQAMVADLVPEHKRAEGYGILRVAFNLAVTIGPAIVGLLATRSYQLLFVSDAVISTIFESQSALVCGRAHRLAGNARLPVLAAPRAFK